MMDLRIVLACLVIGTVTEALSHWQKLWLYEPPWLRIASVVLVFGLFFGWLSTALAEQSALLRFATGAGVGIAYEATNLTLLRAWSFPEQQLVFLRGPVALAVGAGIPWGLIPLVAPLVRLPA
jgi:hypothetical protein